MKATHVPAVAGRLLALAGSAAILAACASHQSPAKVTTAGINKLLSDPAHSDVKAPELCKTLFPKPPPMMTGGDKTPSARTEHRRVDCEFSGTQCFALFAITSTLESTAPTGLYSDPVFGYSDQASDKGIQIKMQVNVTNALIPITNCSPGEKASLSIPYLKDALSRVSLT